MTMAEPGSRMSLKYKLEGTKGDLGRWGHEYLRSLAGEIGQEYSARRMRIVKGDGAKEEARGGGVEAMDADGEDADVSDLIELVDDIVPFHLQHNAEAEAVDLLVEVQVKERKKKHRRDFFFLLCHVMLVSHHTLLSVCVLRITTQQSREKGIRINFFC